MRKLIIPRSRMHRKANTGASNIISLIKKETKIIKRSRMRIMPSARSIFSIPDWSKLRGVVYNTK